MTARTKYAALAVALALIVGALALLQSGDGTPNASIASTATDGKATAAEEDSDDDTPSADTGEQSSGSTIPVLTTGPTSPTPNLAPPPYELAATRRCLRSAGVAVSPIRSTDPRLRALGDLAQRTSLELHLGGQTLGLAFANAQLLADLLRVPDDPYRMQVRRNALLMYPPAARGQVEIVLSCLRT